MGTLSSVARTARRTLTQRGAWIRKKERNSEKNVGSGSIQTENPCKHRANYQPRRLLKIDTSYSVFTKVLLTLVSASHNLAHRRLCFTRLNERCAAVKWIAAFPCHLKNKAFHCSAADIYSRVAEPIRVSVPVFGESSSPFLLCCFPPSFYSFFPFFEMAAKTHLPNFPREPPQASKSMDRRLLTRCL